jgi:TusA-related sulfurtransferase
MRMRRHLKQMSPGDLMQVLCTPEQEKKVRLLAEHMQAAADCYDFNGNTATLVVKRK